MNAQDYLKVERSFVGAPAGRSLTGLEGTATSSIQGRSARGLDRRETRWCVNRQIEESNARAIDASASDARGMEDGSVFAGGGGGRLVVRPTGGSSGVEIGEEHQRGHPLLRTFDDRYGRRDRQ
jgi:hypothetical protein